jgi:hypothetical protein
MAKKRKSRGRKHPVAPRPAQPEFDVEEFLRDLFNPTTADPRLLADPRQWSTELPELRHRPLTREEHGRCSNAWRQSMLCWRAGSR